MACEICGLAPAFHHSRKCCCAIVGILWQRRNQNLVKPKTVIEEYLRSAICYLSFQLLRCFVWVVEVS
jgi:hypothetical protein